MSKLTVETDKYGLVRVKVETTKSGTPVTYRAPANTGLSGQNDQAIAAIVNKINETDDLIPQGTSSENPLVNEKALRELMVNTIGGRTYKTTKIGNQIWLAENLDFKFYGLRVGTEVAASGDPYAAYYNNDEATYGVNGNKYGLLYNWYAVNILNKFKDQLIPGWHVPSREEWLELTDAVGGASISGTKLKSKTGWSSGNGTDDFGFAAFPAGYYNSSSFSEVGSTGRFWMASENTSSDADYQFFDKNASTASYALSKDNCFSLRLVRDA